MVQELNDEELAMVNGSAGAATGFGNITVSIENSFVFAPVFIINSTILHSSIDNSNTYIQSSHIS